LRAEVETRGQILEAAERLIRERGLGAATTREIARRAGCAEGSIYRYFPDKHALFVEIVHERFPEFIRLMEALPERAGEASVEKTLQDVASAAVAFYRGIVPMSCGAVANRELLAQQRKHFEETNTGPLKAIRSLAEYLRREQRLGRVALRGSADDAARVILGPCFAYAFLLEFIGEAASVGSDERFARGTVKTVMEGLAPREAASG
jgi:AcrR family transcriptional regulator